MDWSGFGLVVANGAWDNIHHVDEFLRWIDHVESLGVPVVNSPATLRWNLDKRYLRTLASAGVPIVATQWVEPPSDATGPGATRLDLEGEVVVKPAVSGGGFQTARYRPHEHEAARAHVAALVRRAAWRRWCSPIRRRWTVKARPGSSSWVVRTVTPSTSSR